jgi:hypothetical protein
MNETKLEPLNEVQTACPRCAHKFMNEAFYCPICGSVENLGWAAEDLDVKVNYSRVRELENLLEKVLVDYEDTEDTTITEIHYALQSVLRCAMSRRRP